LVVVDKIFQIIIMSTISAIISLGSDHSTQQTAVTYTYTRHHKSETWLIYTNRHSDCWTWI